MRRRKVVARRDAYAKLSRWKLGLGSFRAGVAGSYVCVSGGLRGWKKEGGGGVVNPVFAVMRLCRCARDVLECRYPCVCIPSWCNTAVWRRYFEDAYFIFLLTSISQLRLKPMYILDNVLDVAESSITVFIPN